MPNITTNKIRFKSKHKSKIRKVRDLLEGHECVVVDERLQSGTMSVFNVFDFNKIIPMPYNIFNVDLTEEERKSDMKKGSSGSSKSSGKKKKKSQRRRSKDADDF